MENTNNAKNYQNSNLKRVFLTPTGYSVKGDYVTIFFGDQLAYRVHKNYHKKILDIEFIPVSQLKDKQEVA